MPVFCGNCGTQLRTGAKFCQSCGTPAPQPSVSSMSPTLPIGSAPAPPPAPTPSAVPPSGEFGSYEPPVYGPPPSYSPAPSAPVRKSSGVWKAVFITLAVFMVLVVAAVAGIGYFVTKTAREIAAKKEINTPLGNVGISTGEVTEEKLGLPIYQPSTQLHQGVNLRGGNREGRGAIVVGVFTTEDSAEQVADFYREKLSDGTQFSENAEAGAGRLVLTARGEQGLRTVVIEPDGESSKTKFTVTSITGGRYRGGPPPPPPAPPAPPPQ
jgi:hypothetical protein